MNVLNVTSLLSLPGMPPNNDVILRRAAALNKRGVNVMLLRPVNLAPPIIGGFNSRWRTNKTLFDLGEMFVDGVCVKICRTWDANPPHVLRKHFHLETPVFIRRILASVYDWAPSGRGLEGFRPDVIHSEYLYPDGALGARLARKLNVPHIITLREMTHIKLLRNSIAIADMNRAALVISPSRVIASRAAQAGVKRVKVLPHYVEESFYETSQLRPAGPVRFISVSRLISLKNISYVINALAKLDSGVQWEYSIVGEGPEKANLIAQVANLRLQDKITFHGFVENSNIAKRFHFFDYLVMPSSYEAFGIVYAEALAMGLGLITIKGGGIDGYIPGLPGVYYVRGPDDIEPSIQFAASSVQADRATRLQRRDAAKQFSKECVLREFESMYRSTCTI